MPEAFRLYLDQMIQKYVAEVLSGNGYDKVSPTTAKNILNLLRPFLHRTTPDEIVNHLVILSANKEKWILTSSG